MKFAFDNWQIGADPEVFVFDEALQQPISAHNLLEGSKEQPLKVDSGAVQVDGTAAEFNVDPTNDSKVFHDRLYRVMEQMDHMIKARNPNARLNIVPVQHYPKAYFDSLPEENRRLGCDPDYNAYTGEENPIPDNEKTFRTGSGHIHIGWTEGANIKDKDFFAKCCYITKLLDVTLGVCSVLCDNNNERRILYGKAGAFRPKPYGLEYRVLSNAWLRHPELTEWIFNSVNKTLSVAASSNFHPAEDILWKFKWYRDNDGIRYSFNKNQIFEEIQNSFKSRTVTRNQTIWREYFNKGNIPKLPRSCFHTPELYDLIYGDK